MSENNGQADLFNSNGKEIPELRTIITISVNRAGQLVVAYPVGKPDLTLHAIADALKVVAEELGKSRLVVANG